jgi:hypothetical protein
MDAPTLKAEIETRGASIRAEAGRLLVRNDGALSEELRASIRESKPALLDLLSTSVAPSLRSTDDLVFDEELQLCRFGPWIAPIYDLASEYEHHWNSKPKSEPRPLPTLPDPLPPMLKGAEGILDRAVNGELEHRDASLVLTAAVEIARMAPTEEIAERLSKTRRGCVVQLMADIAMIDFKYTALASKKKDLKSQEVSR